MKKYVIRAGTDSQLVDENAQIMNFVTLREVIYRPDEKMTFPNFKVNEYFMKFRLPNTDKPWRYIIVRSKNVLVVEV